MTKLTRLAHNVWTLTKGYWRSEERWSARLLLAVILTLNLSLVYVNVLQNGANGALFNALQARNAAGFYSAFGTVMLLIFLYLAVAVLRVYLDQTLQLRWRRWLTEQYINGWLANRTFYRMRFSGRVDNPDQRISEDVRLFIERTMFLGIGLLNAVATFVSFASLLWHLSGSITLTLRGFSVTIPGYMFWVAVLYSGMGSVVAHLIGRPLIRLNNRQQNVEANFRFSLMRLREEAEGIALYKGEAQERGAVLIRFHALFLNFKRLILRNNQYLMFQMLFSQFVSNFALLVSSPRYFSGAIALGPLMQAANAFERVNEALSWFIGSYSMFADWRATIDRLIEFSQEITRDANAPDAGAQVDSAEQETIDLKGVRVGLPDGEKLLGETDLTLKPHQAVLLRGPSGCGKSTLFRVLAGLWPFASGQVTMPKNASTLFLPQRPYLPIGTLRRAVWFPAVVNLEREDDAKAALAAVGLGSLRRNLDERAHWGQVLSNGEQQRLAIARALLIKPDWLFLDEATSAMDEAEEEVLYKLLAKQLPETTLVSIGHRPSLEAHHGRIITVDRQQGRLARLLDSNSDLEPQGAPS